jgi:hypothetical protein
MSGFCRGLFGGSTPAFGASTPATGGGLFGASSSGSGLFGSSTPAFGATGEIVQQESDANESERKDFELELTLESSLPEQSFIWPH